eukprot:CAMPEP_0201574524 /NCGR_PEP_ID=MMETSP0190_2-20130828/19056_1 /ASSEMBLY_ACC=CAM_ASM_000263 /TAXON_ID=37353 /ORGANISM="Rosalina sp." /LENGTH=94 /DNA_ID=CAMNT_0048002857 /DNA_START=45 /DNA_END=326 /DNA_ORIENTATION=+
MIHRSSILLILLLFVLMVLPTKSYNGYYDADEDDEAASKVKKISTKKNNNKKYDETDIGLGKVQMNKESGNYDGDAALSEFTLAAGSHINLRLW